VTNVYKHAFKGGPDGAVSVSFSRLQDLTLVVEDDGAGCPEGAASGVGSQLVEMLVRQLKGNIERTNPGRGCRVHVSFPEKA
jgi:two-component sensor histidine kinase